MTNLQLTRPIAVIDIETTGLNKQEDRIVDICITKILPNGEEETLNSIINPTIPIPIKSTEIHGITDTDIQGKPTFKEFAPKIISFIDNCDLCGFNIIGFDSYVLESEFKRAGINYSNEGRKIIDVLRIYHKLEPRNLSSAHLKYCGTALEKAHRANTDVKATIKVLESQLEKHDDLPRDVSKLNDFCNPKNPSWIDDDGRFSWFEVIAFINFGKHKVKTIEDMHKNELDYLQWMIKEDFSHKVKDILKDAIRGKFPEPTEKRILCKK